jgi:hypothetical protein
MLFENLPVAFSAYIAGKGQDLTVSAVIKNILLVPPWPRLSGGLLTLKAGRVNQPPSRIVCVSETPAKSAKIVGDWRSAFAVRSLLKANPPLRIAIRRFERRRASASSRLLDGVARR